MLVAQISKTQGEALLSWGASEDKTLSRPWCRHSPTNYCNYENYSYPLITNCPRGQSIYHTKQMQKL